MYSGDMKCFLYSDDHEKGDVEMIYVKQDYLPPYFWLEDHEDVKQEHTELLKKVLSSFLKYFEEKCVI